MHFESKLITKEIEVQYKIFIGFLDGYATVGDIGDSIEIKAGEDFDESRYFAYRLVDGKLIYSEEQYQSVINRPIEELPTIEDRVIKIKETTATLQETMDVIFGGAL